MSRIPGEKASVQPASCYSIIKQALGYITVDEHAIRNQRAHWIPRAQGHNITSNREPHNPNLYLPDHVERTPRFETKRPKLMTASSQAAMVIFELSWASLPDSDFTPSAAWASDSPALPQPLTKMCLCKSNQYGHGYQTSGHDIP